MLDLSDAHHKVRSFHNLVQGPLTGNSEEMKTLATLAFKCSHPIRLEQSSGDDVAYILSL